jgi:hypothetical protein
MTLKVKDKILEVTCEVIFLYPPPIWDVVPVDNFTLSFMVRLAYVILHLNDF